MFATIGRRAKEFARSTILRDRGKDYSTLESNNLFHCSSPVCNNETKIRYTNTFLFVRVLETLYSVYVLGYS